jgi:hypothetical protein
MSDNKHIVVKAKQLLEPTKEEEVISARVAARFDITENSDGTLNLASKTGISATIIKNVGLKRNQLYLMGFHPSLQTNKLTIDQIARARMRAAAVVDHTEECNRLESELAQLYCAILGSLVGLQDGAAVNALRLFRTRTYELEQIFIAAAGLIEFPKGHTEVNDSTKKLTDEVKMSKIQVPVHTGNKTVAEVSTTPAHQEPDLKKQGSLEDVKDNAFSSNRESKAWSQAHGPSHSRLSSNTGWVADTNDVKLGAYIQIAFEKPVYLFGVTILGRGDDKSQFVTKYRLEVRCDDEKFRTLGVFYGTQPSKPDLLVKTSFLPILVKYVRLTPVECHGHISLRWDLNYLY